MTAPAGWYPDPESDEQLRWWDGEAWSDRRTPRSVTERVLPSQVAGPGADDEVSIAPWRDAPPPVQSWRSAPEPSRSGEAAAGYAVGPGYAPAAAGAVGEPVARRPIGIGDALLIIAAWFGGQVAGGLIGGVVIVVTGGDLEDPGVLAAVALASLLVSLIGVVGLLRLRLGSWARVTGERRANGWLTAGAFVVGALAPIVIGLGTDALARLMELQVPDAPSQDILAGLADASGLVVVLTAIVVVAIAPVVEELVFRRGLFAALDSRMPTVVAVMLSAAIFAAIHVELFLAGTFGLLQVGGLFLLGVLFAVLYRVSSSSWPSIAAHAGFNLVGVIAVVVAF